MLRVGGGIIAEVAGPPKLRSGWVRRVRGGFIGLAVGLGGDTDTLGAVTGSLAGTHYGEDSIPGEWVGSLRRRGLLEGVLVRFVKAVEKACRHAEL